MTWQETVEKLGEDFNLNQIRIEPAIHPAAIRQLAGGPVWAQSTPGPVGEYHCRQVHILLPGGGPPDPEVILSTLAHEIGHIVDADNIGYTNYSAACMFYLVDAEKRAWILAEQIAERYGFKISPMIKAWALGTYQNDAKRAKTALKKAPKLA